jgi:hypothetical protein
MILVADASALIQAKRMGLVPRVKPLIDLIAASPVYIGKNLMQIVLELAGESAEQGSANSI